MAADGKVVINLTTRNAPQHTDGREERPRSHRPGIGEGRFQRLSRSS